MSKDFKNSTLNLIMMWFGFNGSYAT